jgi:hypothetical protein
LETALLEVLERLSTGGSIPAAVAVLGAQVVQAAVAAEPEVQL